MNNTIPFSSYNNIMVVAVDGTGKKHPLGLKDVLFNFRYLCQKNVDLIKRPATKYIGFYVSGGPKKVKYWAIVDSIVETEDRRYYNLESIILMKKPIPLGTIPPNFSGGGVEIPLKAFFEISNLDEIYEHRIRHS